MQPTAQQMHVSYLLMTRAHGQDDILGHVRKVSGGIPELCCYFHSNRPSASCAKGLNEEEDRLEQIKDIYVIQWRLQLKEVQSDLKCSSLLVTVLEFSVTPHLHDFLSIVPLVLLSQVYIYCALNGILTNDGLKSRFIFNNIKNI